MSILSQRRERQSSLSTKQINNIFMEQYFYYHFRIDQIDNMQKCKYLTNRSRFCKAEINEQKKKGLRSYNMENDRVEDSFHRNQKQNTDNLQLPSNSSIRYSIQRLKTGKLQRSQILNRKMAKSTLRKMRRVNTIQKNMQYEQHITCLKQYVNKLNLTCNKVIKYNQNRQDRVKNNKQANNCAKNQRKKFLMQQISFTEIDEEKIETQRKFLGQFQHLTQSLPKMIQTHQSSKQQLKQRQEIIIECLRSIEKVYSVMKEMQNIGFTHKNNKFMIDYCKNGRVWLRKIFLNQCKDKKQNFSIAVKYLVIETVEQAKRKFTQYLAKPEHQNLEMIRKEVTQLVQHLQHCLTQSKIANIMNVTHEIDHHIQKYDRRFNDKLDLEFALINGSRLRLTEDLERIESEFGQMHSIAKVSRRKYEELNKTYDKLQNYL